MSEPRWHIPGHMVTPQTKIQALGAENARLRARLETAESEVRRLLRTVEDARRALAKRLAHAEQQEDTPICTRCHRPRKENKRGNDMRPENDNAQLRARVQAAESALRLLLPAAEDALPMVSLIDDAACIRLAEVVRAINAGLPESPICARCHRPLVVPQVVEHLEWSEGWLHQGGDLPQT